MWSCRYIVIARREKRSLILGAIRGKTRLYSPKRVWSRSSEVATRISSPCVIRGEITTWGSSDRCGQYVSDSVSDHFDPWWYRGFGNSVHGKCCMNVAVCAATCNLHTLTKLQMGSTIRNCSRIVSAILSTRRQIRCNKIGRLVNDLMWIFPRDRKSGRC